MTYHAYFLLHEYQTAADAKPAAGNRNCSGEVNNVGSNGNYWSSTPNDSENAWKLNFNSSNVNMNNNNRCNGNSVRLVR